MAFFHIFTLGCKVNQYESQALREAWIGAGLAETAQPEQAHIIVVNSCAVTAKAVADVRHAVRRLHRAAPQAAIIITGCAAKPQAEEFSALPGVLRVIFQQDKSSLKELLPLLCAQSAQQRGDSPCDNDLKQLSLLGKTAIADTPGSLPRAYPDLAISGYERSRAVLKIQDGCSHGCAFCIVPLTRGGARSRPFAESLAEARQLLEAGFAEIVISGVNLRQYRQENGGFWEFLAGLDAALSPEWAGKARFRLSSLEPGQLDDRALETLSRCRMLAPQLHLSLQSGSASVLRRMGRGHYEPERLPDFLQRLRTVWPVFGLGADILSGFPGETEEEFKEGLALVQGLGLTYAHVFPYSKRPGTKAAAMPDQVPHEVKKKRALLLREASSRGKQAFLELLTKMPELFVVFEDREGGTPRGVCEYYVDCRLSGTARGTTQGLTRVHPLGTDGKTLLVAEAAENVCD